MATIQIRKCEKCDKEARQDSEKDLYEAYLSINLQIEYWPSNLNVRKTYFHLCPDCQAKLGITLKQEHAKAEEQSVADRLYDIIAEIIQVEQQGQ